MLWLNCNRHIVVVFFFQAEDGIRDLTVTGVQTCALPIWRRTAAAATASGGATTAPSAIAAAQGIVGMSAWATTATAAVVNPTATTTRLGTGAQLSLRSLSDASYAASSRTGATNSASARSGGTLIDGAPGRNASSAPPSARNTGYGAPTRRAPAAKTTAATKRPRSCSSSLIPSRCGQFAPSSTDFASTACGSRILRGTPMSSATLPTRRGGDAHHTRRCREGSPGHRAVLGRPSRERAPGCPKPDAPRT